MGKRTSTFVLSLPPRDASQPAYRWLYEGLRAAILDRRLPPGTRLPGTRDLAAQHRLARGTIVAAFEQLEAEGYVEASVGSGTLVSRTLPDDLLAVAHGSGAGLARGAHARRHLSRFARRARPFGHLEVRPSRAFRPNLPAVDLFPTTLWAQLSAQRLRRAPLGLFIGCEPQGYAPLRASVAAYLGASRGVNCEPEQVVIVSGVQEALDLCARLLVDPGDRVSVEDPGYTGAVLAFQSAGARVAPVPVDAEGLDTRSPALRGARLVYTTPAHQFPLGIAMSLRRRLELLQWARSSGALVFEDDYDSEFRYAGRPLPALQGLDSAGVVLYAGSFNKVLFPSLRLGYLVVPPDLVDPFAAVQSASQRHPALLQQAVVCDFIEQGHFGRHLRRMREVYAERLGALLEAARLKLTGLLEVSSIEAGLQTAGWLQAGIGAEAAAGAASERDVEVRPLGRYSLRGMAREGLQLGFAAVDVRELRRGVDDLAATLERLACAHVPLRRSQSE